MKDNTYLFKRKKDLSNHTLLENTFITFDYTTFISISLIALVVVHISLYAYQVGLNVAKKPLVINQLVTILKIFQCVLYQISWFKFTSFYSGFE